jgi:steroid delta-isomerase
MTPLERLVAYWEGLTPEALGRLSEVYAPEAYFRDPFNEVRGIPALQRVFAHMYETLEAPRFTILERISQGESAVLLWDFEFRIRSLGPETVRRIHGASHVRFAPDGRVAYHRDYWDAAGELYAQLPLVGPLARFMARRLRAK